MSHIQDIARNTFRTESEAIAALSANLTPDFDGAVKAILATTGKVIVTGMGKSGIIGRKIAATLSSTGTSSFFLHPADAYHGDLGMVEKNDVLLAISNSGQTDEILRMIPYLESNGNTVIGMSGDPRSTLAKHSHFHLNIAVNGEACPLSLAPTSSTTAMLVMGDALAIALMEERGFKSEDYARFHPGGSLGRRLLTRVGDVMRTEDLPCVPPDMKLNEVIIRISDARLGVAIVMREGKIVGLVTDGDVRRAMQKYRDRFFDTPVEEIMTRSPKIVSVDARITDAEAVMQQNKIHSLIVTDREGQLAGIVELYDLMRGN